MRIRKALVSLTAVLLLAGLTPSVVMAYSGNPASNYDRCITEADGSLHDCLDHAVATEALCWSRYGYAKLWCTIKYAVDSIID